LKKKVGPRPPPGDGKADKIIFDRMVHFAEDNLEILFEAISPLRGNFPLRENKILSL
jgi:biotin synthase-related radical SAM superfamily protein